MREGRKLRKTPLVERTCAALQRSLTHTTSESLSRTASTTESFAAQMPRWLTSPAFSLPTVLFRVGGERDGGKGGTSVPTTTMTSAPSISRRADDGWTGAPDRVPLFVCWEVDFFSSIGRRWIAIKSRGREKRRFAGNRLSTDFLS